MTPWLRRVHPRETPTLLAMRDGAERWLAQRGLDQFQNRGQQARARRDITALAEAGRFRALTTDGTDILAVVAVTGPDMDFWTPADDLPAGMYLARGMVTVHGRGYMATVFDLLEPEAGEAGKRWLRFDAWRTNTALHGYYQSLGFEHVRTVTVAARNSGALFQRPIRAEALARSTARRDLA